MTLLSVLQVGNGSRSRSSLMPVMVWIHGGGFVGGGSHQFGPQFVMREDVILVTVNYRLGVFGGRGSGHRRVQLVTWTRAPNRAEIPCRYFFLESLSASRFSEHGNGAPGGKLRIAGSRWGKFSTANPHKWMDSSGWIHSVAVQSMTINWKWNRNWCQALKWVREHIVSFGGDARKVTVFGESSGGALAHMLTLSPLSAG